MTSYIGPLPHPYFSVPLFFFMAAASHLPIMHPALIVGVFVVSFGFVYYLYKVSPSLGKLS